MAEQKVYSTFNVTDTSVVWKADGTIIRIEPWGTDSVRVRSTKMRALVDDDWALLPAAEITDFGTTQTSLNDEGDEATLINGEITVKARTSHHFSQAIGYEVIECELSFWNARGKLLFKDARAVEARVFEPAGGSENAVIAAFDSSVDEHLSGMGQYQQNIIDLKGCTLELVQRNGQASIPFVVSSQGYGFLWHNPALGEVMFAKNRTVWKARSSAQLDYWVTAGDTPAAIEKNYSEATGRAPRMPEWALGYWQSKDRYWNQDLVLDVARKFKEKKLPISVIVIDFFHWPHMGDYRFEKEFWPDPKAMCDELHSMGIKVFISVWTQVSLESENYDEMRAKNLLVHARHGEDIGMMFEGPSQFFDATNPEAQKYVWEKCKKNYSDYGIDGFWLDEAEPEYGVYSFSNYEYFAGPSEQVGNIYPKDLNKGFYEGQIEQGRESDIVNLTRCAWAGAQKYGALVWNGDVPSTFTSMKNAITTGIHMGIAGIPWVTNDMGGFYGSDVKSQEFRELMARWCAYSCFLPVMRNHGTRSGTLPDGSTNYAVTNKAGERRLPSGLENEPWTFGNTVESIFIKYMSVREKLRPYTRELFEQAHTDGQPLIRGLFYEFPQDEKAYGPSDEYMFGPDLLIAPVADLGVRRRDVYLPGDEKTTWVSLTTGKSFVGGTAVQEQAELDEIPVFARNGEDHGIGLDLRGNNK